MVLISLKDCILIAPIYILSKVLTFFFAV